MRDVRLAGRPQVGVGSGWKRLHERSGRANDRSARATARHRGTPGQPVRMADSTTARKCIGRRASAFRLDKANIGSPLRVGVDVSVHINQSFQTELQISESGFEDSLRVLGMEQHPGRTVSRSTGRFDGTRVPHTARSLKYFDY